jgi:hypothetical protein
MTAMGEPPDVLQALQDQATKQAETAKPWKALLELWVRDPATFESSCRDRYGSEPTPDPPYERQASRPAACRSASRTGRSVRRQVQARRPILPMIGWIATGFIDAPRINISAV